MFFSNSFWFVSVLVLCNCVLWCGMFVLFFGSFFWHVAFLFAGYVYHRKNMCHMRKKHETCTRIARLPPQGTCWPLILVCLFFPLCFCMFWIGSIYPRSCLPQQKEPWITWQRKNDTTFRMEIPYWCWGICTLWSCAQQAECGYPWIKPLTRHSFQNRWNLHTFSNIFKSWAKSCEINGRFPWGQTPLFDAAERGCVSVVEQLLKSGASVGAQSENGLGLNGKRQGNLGKIWWLMHVDVPMYN